MRSLLHLVPSLKSRLEGHVGQGSSEEVLVLVHLFSQSHLKLSIGIIIDLKMTTCTRATREPPYGRQSPLQQA